MSDLTRKLKLFLEQRGISKYKAERDLGLGNGALSKIFERNSGIKSDLLDKILKTYPEFNSDTVSSSQNNMPLLKEIEGLKKEVELLREIIQQKDEMIDLLRQQLNLPDKSKDRAAS